MGRNVPLLDFPKSYLCLEIIFFVNKSDCLASFRTESADEEARVQFLAERYVNSISIRELIDFVSLVDQGSRVQSCVSFEVVAAVIPVFLFRSDCQKVADGGVMGDLFAKDLSAVRVGAL